MSVENGNPFRRPSEPPPDSDKPISSIRLRELAKQLEQVDEKTVRDEIEERLTDFMYPGYKIGSGQTADVYAGTTEDGTAGFCIKHNARKNSESAFDNPLEKEMELQVTALRILRTAREAGKNVGDVPKPWLYLKTKKNQEILSMDRVPGKTLRRLILEQVAAKMPDAYILPGYTRNDLATAHDDDLEEMVIDRYLRAGSKDTKQLYAAFLSKAGELPFLPLETALKVRNSIQELNRQRFFHRDLHDRNIMFSHDLSEVYFIDFGRSSHNEYTSANEAIDVEKVGTRIRYLDDMGILKTVGTVTKKAPKKA